MFGKIGKRVFDAVFNDTYWKSFARYLDEQGVSTVEATEGHQIIVLVDGIPRQVLIVHVTETEDEITIDFEEAP